MHKTILATIISALFGLATTAMPAAAQDQAVALSGTVMKEQVVISDNGDDQVELVAPATVVPGDRLLFGTEYTNDSGETVTDFVVTNPLPAAVRLDDGADPGLIVSVDGGASWGKLADLRVESDGGVSRAAAPIDVTHIRWTLASIAPGEAGRLEYRAIVR